MPTRRGPYGGAVGYLTHNGDLDTAIVIRSALVREGCASVRAGAGVVHDSDPHSEALETRRKAAAVLADLPDLPEPARPDPEAIREALDDHGIRYVDWAAWQRLDAEEIRLGGERGNARVKVADRLAMLAACHPAPDRVS